MKKIVVIVVILIICFGIFLTFEKKQNIERCVIGYMDRDNQIQQVYMYDITYIGIFNKKILNIETIKRIVFFKPSEITSSEIYNKYKDEGEKYKKYFSKYNYELNLEKNKNIVVYFKSELFLENETLSNISFTEYNEFIEKNGKIDYNKLRQYYINNGAICKNIKSFN